MAKNETAVTLLDEDLRKQLPLIMFYDHGDDAHRNELVDGIRQFYFGKVKPAGFKTIDIYSKVFTDGIFAIGISESLKLHSEFQPVYPYYYNYEGQFSIGHIMLSMTGKYPVVVEALLYFAEQWINANIPGREPVKKGEFI